MYSGVFLAMTATELEQNPTDHIAFMALHFSAYNTGLSNMPAKLPDNSILLLDDSMPAQHHNPDLVTKQLTDLVDRFSIRAVLLDFQEAPANSSMMMVDSILQALPCTVAVTEKYASALHCPVFLSPPPVNLYLENYLAPWLPQGVYLDIAPQALEITVAEKGSQVRSLPPNNINRLPLKNSKLHCHYDVAVAREKAVFTLVRTKTDLEALTQDAYRLGVLGVVGLYQELLSDTLKK